MKKLLPIVEKTASIVSIDASTALIRNKSFDIVASLPYQIEHPVLAKPLLQVLSKLKGENLTFVWTDTMLEVLHDDKHWAIPRCEQELLFKIGDFIDECEIDISAIKEITPFINTDTKKGYAFVVLSNDYLYATNNALVVRVKHPTPSSITLTIPLEVVKLLIKVKVPSIKIYKYSDCSKIELDEMTIYFNPNNNFNPIDKFDNSLSWTVFTLDFSKLEELKPYVGKNDKVSLLNNEVCVENLKIKYEHNFEFTTYYSALMMLKDKITHLQHNKESNRVEFKSESLEGCLWCF